MSLEETLLAAPREQWHVARTYVYGWQDGPTHGACEMAAPQCEFFFELLSERYNPDGLDDRIYRLSELPAGSVAELLTLHTQGAGRAGPVRDEADRRIEEIRAARRPTSLVVYSQDMEHFLG